MIFSIFCARQVRITAHKIPSCQIFEIVYSYIKKQNYIQVYRLAKNGKNSVNNKRFTEIFY